MEPIINLEDPIGRQVGRRKAPNPLKIDPAELQARKQWRDAGFGLRVPRGVYRFNSHEEANEWLWKMMTRPKN